MKLANIMINSENPGALGEFYTKVLGEPGWHDGDWFGYKAGAGLMIGPHSEVKGKSQEPPRIMIVFEVDDVKAEFGRVKDAGAAVVAEPYQPDAANSPTVWLATVADPDGNYLQLSTPWPEDEADASSK